jgi:hypothetical protein
VQCGLTAFLTLDLDKALDSVTSSLGCTLHELHWGLQALADQRLQRGRGHDGFSSWVATDLAEDERREDVAGSRPVDADPPTEHLHDPELLASLQDRAVVPDLGDVANLEVGHDPKTATAVTASTAEPTAVPTKAPTRGPKLR